MLTIISVTAAVLALAVLFYASYSIRSGVYLKAYCRKRTSEKTVALTFDDGPHPVQTPAVLDVLKKYDAKAVFFLIGERAEKEPEIVKRIVAEGNAVGNHSYSHRAGFPVMPSRKMERDLALCDEALEKITGEKTHLFRPPFGVTNPVVAGAVKRRGYKTVGWSIRSYDTLGRPWEKVLRRIVKRLGCGQVIMLHDDRPDSEILLERLLAHLKQEGYKTIRADRLLDI